MGKMGQIDDAEVVAAIDRIIDSARAVDMPVGWFGVSAAAVQPYMKGYYTNLNEESEQRTWGNFGDNYPRLVEIKNRYDPTNLFRLNANIRPTL